MKFTLSWLKDYLETEASLEEIGQALTDIGLEVEEISDPAAMYAAFRVAYVEKAEQHPNADRLKVCVVDTGEGKVQVVCGAPNARTGMKGVFAPDGSFIPGTGMTLKKGVIRGEESNGMLVSEREMGLSDEHDGIIEVVEDAAVGTPFAALYGLNDPVIEIGLTPNRADCTGIYGIARDLAAAGLGTLKPIRMPELKETGPCPVEVSFDFPADAQDACPHFTGRFVKGVKNGPSPAWLQQRLKAIGLRPISALVDITNFMTIGYGRPLHVFDTDKFKGNLTAHLSKGGEPLEALNDKAYTISEGMTVISDDRGVIGLGGVVGGVSTGVDETTTNVYIEAAYFDPMRTARTGRALGVVSDARYRFERGVDPAFTLPGLNIAAQMVQELCGGDVSAAAETGSAPVQERTISYNPARVKGLIGTDVPAARQRDILSALGFTIEEKSAGQWSVTVPSWRHDVSLPACLVEEVIRIVGLDDIQPVSVTRTEADASISEPRIRTLMRQARHALMARGAEECITWSFMPAELARTFGSNDNQALTLQNPISSDLDQMRPSILPNLLQAAQDNANKGQPRAALFETGPVFYSTKPEGQAMVAVLLRMGSLGEGHWTGADSSRNCDLYDAKADALSVLKACGAPENVQIAREAPEYYHPGRSGCLKLGKETLACFGELHPAVLEGLDIDGPVVGSEVFLDAIPEPRRQNTTAKPLLNIPDLQPVNRDFAFIVDEGVEAEVVLRAARSADKNLIAAASIFDVYQGKGVEDGKKSLAVSVTLQPRDHTLTDSELEGLSKKIIANVEQKAGGVLRA